MPSPKAGVWDACESPVLLAGSNGHVYETRPTKSLARDLAYEDAPSPTALHGGAMSPEASRRNGRAATAPTLPWMGPSAEFVHAGRSLPSNVRRQSNAEERPIMGMGCGAEGAASPTMRKSRTFPKGGSPRSPRRSITNDAKSKQALVPKHADGSKNSPKAMVRQYEPVHTLICVMLMKSTR
mmetsp:Transcript_2768/g.3356  ORF Transcript_2768/g.3356 Transcript_2768/m.3356 type:complete len:182 (+) Transcript_2768:76-621(+)